MSPCPYGGVTLFGREVVCPYDRCPHYATSWRLPARLKSVPSPSYRTQAQVTARCRERGSRSDADILSALNDRTARKVYQDFQAALGPEGRHRPPLGQPPSRWRVVASADGHWTLRLASEMQLVVERRDAKSGGWIAVWQGDGGPAADVAFERERKLRKRGWIRLRDTAYVDHVTKTCEILRESWR